MTNIPLREIYLDANATTALSQVAKEAFLRVSSAGPHNASSAHYAGSRARQLLQGARQDIVDALDEDFDADNLFFTSGGTEANNLVINGLTKLGTNIFYTAVEHASVVKPAAWAGGHVVPVDANGHVLLSEMKSILDGSAAFPALLCVQAANSETGIVQPIQEIIAAAKAVQSEIFVLVDGAQAIGRVPLDLKNVDALTLSGHKLHAPAGTGFLYLSERLMEVMPRVLKGGDQEKGIRPGTQNVAGAVALASAIVDRMENFASHVEYLESLRDRLEKQLLLKVPSSRVNGANVLRVPNTLNICFPGQDAQSLLARLDADGVYCSVGSACSSARPEASPVLKAMGMSEHEASSCLRFSVSVDNTVEEMNAAVEIIAKCVSGGLQVN